MTCTVVRRVLLARGANLESNTGLGRAHEAVVSLLEKTLVKDWTKAGIIEYQTKTQSFLEFGTDGINIPP